MVILQLALPTTSSANLRPKLPVLVANKQLFLLACVYPIHSNLNIPLHCLALQIVSIVFWRWIRVSAISADKEKIRRGCSYSRQLQLIDAVVSNCINSNITKIYALTQFNSTSLNSHLCRAYSGVGLEVVAAYQSPEARDGFRELLMLMDYQKLIQAHRQSKADITIVALSAEISRETGLGILEVNLKIKLLSLARVGKYGIYVVKKEIMIKLLSEHFPKANGFGSEVIPGAISIGMKVEAFAFDGYWEDMRNIEAFYKQIWKSQENRRSSFYDRDSPLYTLPRNLPPTLITDAVITDSIIWRWRCEIRGTIVGLRTKIGDRAVIEDSVIMALISTKHASISTYLSHQCVSSARG
ncbi:Inactive glucose-1-phosphate adenylyltransferase small subunit 2, chloroplastic [Vitis vinifera]|uniref:Inactive glucose-1-phosphate adenylyltransferase small subunit 2, chloroplastic n=1 Tax=Vitis vinifera TaxID=29760 RepID=A0A438G9Z1_VITVI|nr:Inactive glucose-1-phosphate adenylyltransferase small subunit 2, chloroplastic [Vitis vinifera]